MPPTVLIIAPESAAQLAADSIGAELDATLEVATSRRSGLSLLRRQEYDLILLDETLAAADPETAGVLYQTAAMAIVLEINFAITSTSRIVRQMKAALQRRSREQQQARTFAARALQDELSGALAGLLLESQLALREAAPAQVPKLQHLVELADDLRNRLRPQ